MWLVLVAALLLPLEFLLMLAQHARRVVDERRAEKKDRKLGRRRVARRRRETR
jgi:hypothetical protein